MRLELLAAGYARREVRRARPQAPAAATIPDRPQCLQPQFVSLLSPRSLKPQPRVYALNPWTSPNTSNLFFAYCFSQRLCVSAVKSVLFLPFARRLIE